MIGGVMFVSRQLVCGMYDEVSNEFGHESML